MGYPANVSVDFMKQINNAANDARLYSVSTNNFAISAGGSRAALSLFWTARASKIVVLSAKALNANVANSHQINKTTTDPNLSGFSISGLVIRPALANQSASTAALTSATEAVSNGTGTLYRGGYMATNTPFSQAEYLPKVEDYIIIPPGIAGGVLLLMAGASTNGVAGELIWAEII